MTEKKSLAVSLFQAGTSYSTIADTLGISHDAVKSFLLRSKGTDTKTLASYSRMADWNMW